MTSGQVGDERIDRGQPGGNAFDHDGTAVMHLEWRFAHPRQRVCVVALDTERWPLMVEGFRPVFGTKFSSGPLPTLTTDYVGQVECVVTKVLAGRLLALYIRAARNSGPPTCWYLRSGLFETSGDGTSARTDLYGVHLENPDERVLLSIVRSIVLWIYGHTNAILDQSKSRCGRGTQE